jgi:GntR family transcriptional regulator
MANNSVAQRLHAQLWRIINDTKPGERLPSEPYLAEQLGVSRATLREAMRAFETQGLIRRRQGSGTYVNETPRVIESGLEVLESIETLAQHEGISVDFGRLEVEQRTPTAEERKALGITDDAEVVSISRTITIDGRAVAYLVDTLPLGLISAAELESGFRGSILDLLLNRGEPRLTASRTDINAAPASPLVARALGIQRGDVLLCFSATLFADDGRAVDYSISYFLPGHFRFHVVRRVGQQSS